MKSSKGTNFDPGWSLLNRPVTAGAMAKLVKTIRYASPVDRRHVLIHGGTKRRETGRTGAKACFRRRLAGRFAPLAVPVAHYDRNKSADTQKRFASVRTCASVNCRSPRRIIAPSVR